MRGRQVNIRWTVKKAPVEDQDLVGRWLPQQAARQALSAGMYSDGTVIEINTGNLAGEWTVQGKRLCNPQGQVDAKLHKTAQPVML